MYNYYIRFYTNNPVEYQYLNVLIYNLLIVGLIFDLISIIITEYLCNVKFSKLIFNILYNNAFIYQELDWMSLYMIYYYLYIYL